MPCRTTSQKQHEPEGDGICYFDKLPDELRLEIYDLLLGGNVFSLSTRYFKTRASLKWNNAHVVAGKAVVATDALHSDASSLKRFELELEDDVSERPIVRRNRAKILRVSKRVYSEALPILYAKNHLCFMWPWTFDDFTKQPLKWSAQPVENEANAVKYSKRQFRPGFQYTRSIELRHLGRCSAERDIDKLAFARSLRSLTISVGPEDAKVWMLEERSGLFKELCSYFVALDPSKRQEMLTKTKFVTERGWKSRNGKAFSSDEADSRI